jgi:Toprim-like
MTIFESTRVQRWKCHACGEGGTAIDLWMVSQRTTVGDAITALAERSGATAAVTAGATPRIKHLLATPTRSAPPTQVDAGGFDVRVESYVASAADLLWSAPGRGALQWLHGRGFADPVLKANRVGFDPGPRRLRRPKGLPYRGNGIVLPILGPGEHAIWAQTRYLDPIGAGRKYDSVVSDIAPNPRVAVIRAAQPPRPGVVVLSEGIPDGLTVAHTLLQPVAVVGTGNTGPDVAQRLHAAFPHATFVVAFDNDTAGRATGPKLGAHLADLGHKVIATTAHTPHNDLNDWWRADPAGLTEHLDATAQPTLCRPTAVAVVPTPAL